MVAVVPDPDGPGQRAKLVAALRGFEAVVGESVEPAELPASLPAAQLALALRARGVLGDDPVHVERHLAALIVHQRPAMLRSLRRRLLAPLDGQPPATRERLTETLRSWLTQLGNRQAMARELHVHPQTVRYRLAQLRELFGADLDDPRTRAALTLALYWSGPGQDRSDLS
jgi:DNA-binding PucR family transcriptional regulator